MQQKNIQQSEAGQRYMYVHGSVACDSGLRCMYCRIKRALTRTESWAGNALADFI